MENLENVAHSLEHPDAEEVLQSAGVLSYETPETICGADNRSKIGQTNTFPYYWIAHLTITMPDGNRYLGSAWLAAPGIKDAKYNVIMTSGHCVYAKNIGFASSIDVGIARNESLYPYGKYTVTTENLRASAKWKSDSDSDFDYGAILIPRSQLSSVGWLGWNVMSDADMKDRVVTNCGYPGDKPTGTLWIDGGPVTTITSRKIRYMNDTFGGQSGSPTYTWADNNIIYAVGIHGYGGCPNGAVRITSDVANDIRKWANGGA